MRIASAIPKSVRKAMPSSVIIGPAERFALVMTSAGGTGTRDVSSSSKRCNGVYGSITPRVVTPGLTPRAQPAAGTLLDEHDGVRRRGQQRPRLGARDGDALEFALVAHHDRERLVTALFPRAQAFDGVLVGGIAREVVTAEAFQRDDLPRAQQPARPRRTHDPRAHRRSGSTMRRRGPHAGQAIGSA